MLTDSHHFKGNWITSKEFLTLERINVFHRYLEKADFSKSAYQNCHILFRKSFHIKSFSKAFIYISADDYYKLYINGKFISSGPAPSYYDSYNYNKIDVSGYLINGENTIAVHTYYQGLINRVWVSGDNCHGLILDLDCDGINIVCSDETFLYKYHGAYKKINITGYNTQFMESYDANSGEIGFEKTAFDDSDWEKAYINNNIDYKLIEQKTSQLVYENIEPIRFMKTEFGCFIDFGKNYCGYLNFIAKGNKHDKIKILYGQELNNSGRVVYKMRANCVYKEEMILSGNKDKYDNFDYKAFRYVEIIVQKNTKVEIDSVALAARHYPFELTAKVNTNDKDIKSIWDLCLHTLKFGVQETIQDCPDREKGFYLGDSAYIALTLGKLTNDWSLFKKTVDDALNSLKYSPTLLTCLDCSLIQEIAEFPLILINSVSIYYEITNDKAYINAIKEKLITVLNYYKDNYTSEVGLISKCDKWCVVEWPDNFRDNYDVNLEQDKYLADTHCVINAYYYSAMVSINNILGYNYYDTVTQKRLVINHFYNLETQLFNDSITSRHSSFVSNMFCYAFDLCPNQEIELKMLDLLNNKGINSLNIFAAFPLLYKLQRSGNKEILLNQIKDQKAWLNMLKEGATTTFETWSKAKKWNTSLFHLTLSYIAFFIKDM